MTGFLVSQGIIKSMKGWRNALFGKDNVGSATSLNPEG
jgi:hypothetical protein